MPDSPMWTIIESDEIDLLFVPQRNSMAQAYQGFFPDTSPFPTDDMLRDEWRVSLSHHRARAFLALIDGLPVGVVTTFDSPEFDEGEVERLYVDPRFWGHHIGHDLLETALAHLHDSGHTHAGLWVLEANAPARAYYERRGWKLLPGITKAPYGSTTVRYRTVLQAKMFNLADTLHR